MCRRVTCRTCGKPSWAGCGAHVEEVLADVPASERCRCREQRLQNDASRAGAPTRSVFDRLFGRRS